MPQSQISSTRTAIRLGRAARHRGIALVQHGNEVHPVSIAQDDCIPNAAILRANLIIWFRQPPPEIRQALASIPQMHPPNALGAK